jgi:cell wall-associated NlpC family hydrolase
LSKKNKTKEYNQKNNFTGLILPVCLFLTASAAMPAGTAAYGMPELQSSSVKTVDAPIAKDSIFTTMGDFSVLNMKIDTLEGNLEAKDVTITFLKEQKKDQLAQQVEQYVVTDQSLLELRSYVGTTPYVLGGSTPRAWDCSGLTLWFYETYRGITLPHSATAQQRGGTEVLAPIPGDIVAFTRLGFQNAYHVGIYLGGGLMIDALNADKDTVIQDVNGFSKSNSIKVAYIRY